MVKGTARTAEQRAVSLARLPHHFFLTGRTIRFLEKLRTATETPPALKEEEGILLAKMRE